MSQHVIPTILWLIIGIVLLAYILRHDIGRVLRWILIAFGIMGVAFSVTLLTLNYEILMTLYHAWVTTLIFILIMVILAVGGR